MDKLTSKPKNKKGAVVIHKNNRHILREPVKHSLIDIFKELKFGRTTASQKYLQRCIEDLERWDSNL